MIQNRKYNIYTVIDINGNTLGNNLNSREVADLTGSRRSYVAALNKKATKPFNLKGFTIKSKAYGGVYSKTSTKKGHYKYTIVDKHGNITKDLNKTNAAKIIGCAPTALYGKEQSYGHPFYLKKFMVHLNDAFNGDTRIYNPKPLSVKTKTKTKTVVSPKNDMSYTVETPNGVVRANMSYIETQQMLSGVGFTGILAKGKLALPITFEGFTAHDATVYDGSYRCPTPKPKSKVKKKKVEVIDTTITHDLPDMLKRNRNNMKKTLGKGLDSPTTPLQSPTVPIGMVDINESIGSPRTIADRNMYTVLRPLEVGGVLDNLLFTQNISSVSTLTNCDIEVLNHYIATVGLPIRINNCEVYDALSFNSIQRANKDQPEPIDIIDKIFGDYTIVDKVHGNTYENLTDVDMLSHGINVDMLNELTERYGYPVGVSDFTIFDNGTYSDWYGTKEEREEKSGLAKNKSATITEIPNEERLKEDYDRLQSIGIGEDGEITSDNPWENSTEAKKKKGFWAKIFK